MPSLRIETEPVRDTRGKVIGQRLLGPLPLVGRAEFVGRMGTAECAWCGADLGPREGIPEGEVTHGICPSCSDTVFKEALDAHRETCRRSDCEICQVSL